MERAIEETETGPDIVPGIHLRVVAEDFKVHLRTVFRWVGRNWLTSINGRITDDYRAKILPDWNRSSPFKEAAKKLKVSRRTLMAWKRKGLVETVRVMGVERVYFDSIKKIIKRRKMDTFSLYSPLYNIPNRLLKITGVNSNTLRTCLDKGIVSSITVNGHKLIPNKEIEKIAANWNCSCRPSAAGRILGRNKSTIADWLAKGRLKPIIVLGQARILLSSIAKTPEEKRRLKNYRSLERKKFSARKNYWKLNNRKKKKLLKIRNRARAPKKLNKFLCKRLNGYQPPKRPVPVPDYTPQRVIVSKLGSKRLTSCEEAAKTTGETVAYIKNLYKIGVIRGEAVNNKVFIYMSSLEVLVAKIKRGTIR